MKTGVENYCLAKMIFLGLSVFLNSACHHVKHFEVQEYFDENTYTAVIRANDAALFIARKPALSAHGGDMVSIAPVYTIISSNHKQALWLGFWTTIDRLNIQEERFGVPDEVVVDTGSQRMVLKLDANFAPQNTDNWQTYPLPAPGTRNLYYPVTDEQLAILSSATKMSIRVRHSKEKETIYRLSRQLVPILDAYMKHMNLT